MALKKLLIISICLSSAMLFSSCAAIQYIHDYTDPAEPRFASLNAVQPPHPKKTIKVVSYNIKLSQKIDQGIALLKENSRLKEADIICLQEMAIEEIKKIADTLQYNFVYYPSAIHSATARDFGNAVLSKWPILNDKKILLPYRKADRIFGLQRIAVEADILINGHKIKAISTHLGVLLQTHKRRDQIATILSSLPPETQHVIISGDFNTYSRAHIDAIVEPFSQAGFNFATQGIGWTHKYFPFFNKKLSLDHIFTKGMEVLAAGKVIDRTASDHLPIWAELSFQ